MCEGVDLQLSPAHPSLLSKRFVSPKTRSFSLSLIQCRDSSRLFTFFCTLPFFELYSAIA